MSKLAKSLAAAAGNAGADAPNVADVFSTYLYEATGSATTITNGIDLSTEGGLVWFKDRNVGDNHYLYDTERGITKQLMSNATSAESTTSTGITAVNTDGYTMGTFNGINRSGYDFASWTFRKAPRFFDVVTYTGDGTDNRSIAHDLECDVGLVTVKCTSVASDWNTFHRSYLWNGPYGYTGGKLNTTVAFGNTGAHDTGVTANSTHLEVNDSAGSNFVGPNQLGETYVAYLFAHDPVGENDDGMIACGSYTGNATYQAGPIIDLGWEPQYVMVKAASGAGSWYIMDTMRGLQGVDGTAVKYLKAEDSLAENTTRILLVNPTGFQLMSNNADLNGSGVEFIYMAIRAPMMKEPEAGTEVFAIDSGSGSTTPTFDSTFPVDWAFHKTPATSGVYYGWEAGTRLLGDSYLRIDSTSAETSSNSNFAFDINQGWGQNWGSTYMSWMFKRAKGFFDVVAYTGNGTAGRTVNHSLGVVPEMMIVKGRSYADRWCVYSPLGNTKNLTLNESGTPSTSSVFWNNTSPTSSVFTIGADWAVNKNTTTYIAYLFATLAGVSKVGSYTGNGTNQNIACGFSAGARFVLIRRTDSNSSDWYIWDTTRGIVTGNDPHLSLNTTAAEVTSDDSIDPESAGFTVNQVAATNINVTSAEYIFLAIA